MSQGDSVILETSLGEIKLELYWNHAPRVGFVSSMMLPLVSHEAADWYALQTCQNFAELAKRGYYNGVVFHRIIAVSFIPSTRAHCNDAECEGFHGARRRPDGHGARWDEHIRTEVVRVYGLSFWEFAPETSYSDSEDEIHPELRFTGAGILAMANSGPNTNGTVSV